MSVLTNLAERVLRRAAAAEQKGLALVHTKVEGDAVSWTVKNLTGGNIHEVINEALKYYAELTASMAEEAKKARVAVGTKIKEGLRTAEADAGKVTKVAVSELDKVKSKSQQRREAIQKDATK